MGTTFNGGINIAFGFKLEDNTPLDDRFVVPSYDDLVTIERKYDGLLVYVQEEKTYYSYDDSEDIWIIFNSIINTETKLISIDSVVQVGNQFTYTNIKWKVDGVEFLENSHVEIINPASENNYRIDILVGDNSGVISRIQGVEDESNPIQPFLPVDTVLVSVFSIFGDSTSIVIPSIPNLQSVMEVGSIAIIPQDISIVSADFDNDLILGIEYIRGTNLTLYKQNTDGSTGFDLAYTNQGIKVFDTIDEVGLYYSSDYSANNIANPRWIPDKDYVDSKVGGLISSWSAGTYASNIFTYKYINNQQYLFRSLIDTNTTEPLLYSNVPAWNLSAFAGIYTGEWSGTGIAGDFMSYEGWLYWCYANTTEPPNTPLSGYWFKIGKWQGLYNASTIYKANDVVRNAGNNIYMSNINNNSYGLTYGIVSQWEVINGQKNTIDSWGDSFTKGAGASETGNYVTQLKIASGLNISNQGVSGETSTQIKTRFLADPKRWSNPCIFWVGYNNNSDPTTVKADLAEMISKLTHDRYLVIGLVRSTTDSDTNIPPLNADLEALYKGRFINMESRLYQIYDITIPQDVTDHTNGKIAWSMRSDWLHLSEKGYYHAAKIINEKIHYLLGQENSDFSDLSASVIQITNTSNYFKPVNAVEISLVSGIGYINKFNRLTNTVGILSIQYPAGSELRLIENGGILKIGNLSGYTSGNVERLVRRISTGEIVSAPSITSGYFPVTDSNGNFVTSPLYTNGTNIGLGKIPTYTFDVNGTLAAGGANMAFVVGQLNSTQAFVQFLNKDLGLNGNGQIFVKQLQVGSGLITPTTDGEIAVFDGQVKVATATLPNSAVNKAQLDSYIIGSFHVAGNWDASGSTFPTTGTGLGGIVRQGDTYKVSVAGTIGGQSYDIGDAFYALVDTPGQTSSNWARFDYNTQQATAILRGTMFLYTSTGSNTDGTITQAAITNLNATNIKQGGNIFGAPINIGSNDDFAVTFNRNGVARLALIGDDIVTSNIANIRTADSGSIIAFNSNLMDFTKVLTTGSNPFFRFNTSGAGTGDIVNFRDGVTLRAGVRKDGRTFGTDGSTSNDYYTFGQATTALALKANIIDVLKLLGNTSLPIYADEAAAITGGLSTGDIYKTATGELRIKL